VFTTSQLCTRANLAQTPATCLSIFISLDRFVQHYDARNLIIPVSSRLRLGCSETRAELHNHSALQPRLIPAPHELLLIVTRISALMDAPFATSRTCTDSRDFCAGLLNQQGPPTRIEPHTKQSYVVPFWTTAGHASAGGVSGSISAPARDNLSSVPISTAFHSHPPSFGSLQR